MAALHLWKKSRLDWGVASFCCQTKTAPSFVENACGMPLPVIQCHFVEYGQTLLAGKPAVVEIRSGLKEI